MTAIECNPIETDQRPWGHYEVLLDSSDCKVKRITVKPTGRLSYQKHQHREELWTIIAGTAHITLNDKITSHQPGEVIHIPKGALHRIENQGEEDVIFIEIQRGTYFGEDDIIRVEDNYGRT